MAERRKEAGRSGDFPYYVSIPYFQQNTWKNRGSAPNLNGSSKFSQLTPQIRSEIDVS
jgi:hypothetical protein